VAKPPTAPREPAGSNEAGAAGRAGPVMTARVLTAHGTMLYIDEASGLLCDGPVDDSPKNVVLAIDSVDCRIMHYTGRGFQPVSLSVDHRLVVAASEGTGPQPTAALALEIVGLGRQRVGFKHNQLFLSAQGEGRIGLLKQDCRAWEMFQIEHPTPTAGASHGYGYDLSYLFSIDQVDGWLDDTAAAIIHRMLRYQVKTKVHGHTLEIGVHHGRLFLLLATGTDRTERAVAIDIFDDQHLNESLSGRGDRVQLERNICRYAPEANTEILKADSMDLGEEFVTAHSGMRFISIDGGHTRDITCNDLQLAERLLVRGGIVALDDIYSCYWSGVTAGVHKYYLGGGRLIPFALIPNKVLFALDHYYSRDYSALLKLEFAHALANVPAQFQKQQFFGFDGVIFCR
jgi:Methyltransferase domain